MQVSHLVLIVKQTRNRENELLRGMGTVIAGSARTWLKCQKRMRCLSNHPPVRWVEEQTASEGTADCSGADTVLVLGWNKLLASSLQGREHAVIGPRECR